MLDARCAIRPIDCAKFEFYLCTLATLATDPRSYVQRLSASVALPASSFAFVSGYQATVQVQLISLEIDSNCINYIIYIYIYIHTHTHIHGMRTSLHNSNKLQSYYSI